MAPRLTRIFVALLRLVVAVVFVVATGWLVYWTWRQGHAGGGQKTSRELTVKEPSYRAVDPKSNEVFLRLDRATQERIGLRVEPLRHASWQKTVKAPGFTISVPHRQAEVRTPWTGVFEPPPGGALPAVGQRVAAGQHLGNLSVLWSPSDRVQLETQLREARGTILETEAQIAVARNTVARLRQIDQQVVASKLLLEAEGSLAQLDARLKAAKARESDLREVVTSKSPESRFRLLAPQGGQVTQMGVRPGEVLAAGTVVAAIYDPSELWVTALVPLSQAAMAEIPRQAEVLLQGIEATPLPARLVQVGPQTAPQQQSLELVYRAENPERRVPVGLFAETKLCLGPTKDTLVVPLSALVQWQDRRRVYLQRSEDEFVKHEVDVEGEDGQFAYLRPTLPAGAKAVVVRGVQTLLSEEHKEAIQLVEEGGRPSASESQEADED